MQLVADPTTKKRLLPRCSLNVLLIVISSVAVRIRRQNECRKDLITADTHADRNIRRWHGLDLPSILFSSYSRVSHRVAFASCKEEQKKRIDSEKERISGFFSLSQLQRSTHLFLDVRLCVNGRRDMAIWIEGSRDQLSKLIPMQHTSI